MLSAADIHAFVRDERAWKRAAQKPGGDDALAAGMISSKESNWLVFRRGTSDNAFSLKFSNALRASAFTDSFGTAASSNTHSAVPRQRWNSSARCDSEDAYADPLQQLLIRNMKLKGVAAMLSKRRLPQLARPSYISHAAREARRRSDLTRAAQELIDLERFERHQVVAMARSRFDTMVSAFFVAAEKDMIACEISGRRALFREWQEARRNTAASMDREFSKLTSMTPHEFKAICRLIRSEDVMRRRVQATEAQDRDLYARFMHLERLKALGKELNERPRRDVLHEAAAVLALAQKERARHVDAARGHGSHATSVGRVNGKRL
ncbi:conserved hypothetical protein [Leishmania infantum JPCM5]|uniref:Uncharacterized protein n=2 Tax=Leishmania infantum TaxID=5671 RepID=A4HYJ7_LEIIN|nr:conserved hypothetical protein [Leishmania infantum JPCM5]CAC9483995.1 hypothetical_protein_-_conserved [Leishmania infantum]CAM67382.1 conserved hypothetical protein [Leishmania infantum JPCM5]SUZ41282.1 hypothetical_protein_-_conserved [Leishmania infantum]|eukprot:XP_001465138.1 conserved hypothetical protein [Leishmania infantum JPCM5]